MNRGHVSNFPHLDEEGNKNRPTGILSDNDGDTMSWKDEKAMMQAEFATKENIVSKMDFIVAEGTHLILQITTSDENTRLVVLPPGIISMTTVISHSASRRLQ
jgi:hypothetical protein